MSVTIALLAIYGTIALGVVVFLIVAAVKEHTFFIPSDKQKKGKK